VLELGESPANTHRPVPLNYETEHRRVPEQRFRTPELARTHMVKAGPHKIMPAASEQRRDGDNLCDFGWRRVRHRIFRRSIAALPNPLGTSPLEREVADETCGDRTRTICSYGGRFQRDALLGNGRLKRGAIAVEKVQERYDRYGKHE
jgi:hypothetical protein